MATVLHPSIPDDATLADLLNREQEQQNTRSVMVWVIGRSHMKSAAVKFTKWTSSNNVIVQLDEAGRPNRVVSLQHVYEITFGDPE